MELDSLSYRELQAKAKKHNIPANKKREELIRMLKSCYEGVSHVEASFDESVLQSFSINIKEESFSQQNDVPEENQAAPPVQANLMDRLAETLSSTLVLKGVATPKGKKTLFNFDDFSPQIKHFVNWG